MGERSFACLSSMAVGAPDLALVDLRFDPGPTPTSSRVCGYVGHLLGDVVELEHHDVGLAAVNARVLTEIFDDVFPNLGAPLRDMPHEPRLFTFVVLSVVPRVGLGEALATPGLELRLTSTHRRKRFERLRLAAFRARSHEGRACRDLNLGRIGRLVGTAVLDRRPRGDSDSRPTASKAAALSTELRGQVRKGYRFTSVYQAEGRPLPSSTLTTSNASANVARTSSAVIPTAGPPGANA